MKSLSIKLLFCLFLFATVAKGQSLPAKNKAIIAFAESKKGKKVGKGECWDLAKAALDAAGADWTPPYGFGKELDPKKDTIIPGDIIQLEKVKIVNPDKSWQDIPHHTAIISQVLAPNKYVVAEQNANGKHSVIFAEMDLNNMKKGKYSIYRPQ